MIGTICETLAVTMPTYKEHDMRAEADAKLMAAAPDLLAALKDVIDQLEAIGIPDWHGAEGLSLGWSRAAIAKAEGRDF
jgi:hypothetical protein